MSDNMSIDKKEPSKDNSDEDSEVSSPENEAGPSAPQETQPAKRKGGRKPVCLENMFSFTRVMFLELPKNPLALSRCPLNRCRTFDTPTTQGSKVDTYADKPP
jgi:hypothetical protein